MTKDEFKQIRSDLSLTQTQLADWLKSSLRSVQRWESGERAISGPVSVCMGYFVRTEDLLNELSMTKPLPSVEPFDGFKALGVADC